MRLMRLGSIGKCGTCALLVGKFGSAGKSLAIRLGRQFGSVKVSICKFGSVGNSAALAIRLHWPFGSIFKFGSVDKFGSVGNLSAIQLRWRLRLQIRIHIRRQFGCIGNSAPSVAPLANSDPSALHQEFGCIGNSAASANSSANNWLCRQLRRQIIGSIGKLGFCGSSAGKWRTHAQATITNNNKPDDDGRKTNLF
jgi:hypothetical protein